MIKNSIENEILHEAPGGSGSKTRIMVVEDEGIVAMDIRGQLQRFGYEVTSVVSNGLDALSQAQKDHPDLVLMDIMLKKGIDGIETAERLKNELHLPVLYLTAYGDDSTIARVKKTEPLGFLLKPFEERDLRIAVELALSRSQVDRDLRRVNDELNRLSQIKSDFASMLAHELKTPLSSIREGINLVLDGVEGPVSANQQETLELARNNVDRLTRLINNILDYSQVDSGKMNFVFEEIDLCRLLEEAVLIMRPLMDKRKISFSLQIPSEALRIQCDADKIEQVIINLLDNAVKYSESGGRIALSLFPGRDPRKVTIVVEDHGIGIKENDQNKVFEMFSRSDYREVARVTGFGVGLAVCKYIIDQHLGQITVTSTYRKGSRFEVTLPTDLSQ